MGAGKSTVGARVADRLGWPFVDTDAILAARHGGVARQIEQEGLAVFRAREAALIAELSDGARRVVATGGGTLEAPGAFVALAARHRLVWLDAPLSVLAARVSPVGRPLWDALVEERYRERRGTYARADAIVDATRPIDTVVDAVLRAWEHR